MSYPRDAAVEVIPPDSSNARDLSLCWAQQERISEDYLPDIEVIGQSLSLINSSSDEKLQVFEVRSPISKESVYLWLNVCRGSIMTIIWSIFARMDEEYIVYLSTNLSLTLKEVKKCRVLVHMKGIDVSHYRVEQGVVDWNAMQSLHSLLGLKTLGLFWFAKQLFKLLISLPLYLRSYSFQIPVPAAIM